MRLPIGLALSVSALLILTAGYFRSASPKPQSGVISVETTQGSPITYSGGNASNTPKINEEKLTTTDLISRQLILDYIDLAASGEIGPQNTSDLVDRYLESISDIKFTSQVSVAELNPVENSVINFDAYAVAMSKINQELSSTTNNSPLNKIEGDPDSASYLAMKKVSEAYRVAGEKMKKLPVPIGVLQPHLKMVAMYLENADAWNTLSGSESDSMLALAGIGIIGRNLGQEQLLITDLNRILSSNVK